ncbi:MAG: uroporphyrinogen decarboxylase family protein [Thermodesulfobacteriota bacterium]
MNSTERVQLTLMGQPVDRRAFAPVLSLYGARLTDCPTDQYYTDPEAYAKGQTAILETFKPDFLLGPFSMPMIGAAYGSELRYLDGDSPNIIRPVVRSMEEWDRLTPPDPDNHPILLYIRAAIRRLAAEHGGQVPLVMVLPTPADLPELIMGLDLWMETVLFNSLAAQRMMAKIIPFWVQLANNCFQDGANILMLPCGFASPRVVTREIVATITRPALATALAQLQGPVVLHNVGGPLLPYLDLLTGLPSTIGYAMDQADNLGQARQVVGPELVLLGGLDCINLARITSAQVEEACLAVLDDRRHDGRFILGTSGPDVPWSTPPENIHAMRKAAESFGWSPS